MIYGWLLLVLLLLPIGYGASSLCLRSRRMILQFCAVGTLNVAIVAIAVAAHVFKGTVVFAAGNWFMLDALSAYHLIVMTLVFSVSAFYAILYFGGERDRGNFTLSQARHYSALWFGTMAAMILVLISNNLGIMWVGIEATTLLTAFLICIHRTAGALEAMWKYLLMCSVGVAVAFVGTLLVAASALQASLQGSDALLWSTLIEAATQLNPALLKAGFIFVVIGYGTKAGLAPMHNWLPDAHSQAPAPVSAVFSGFLLNVALYCILRYLPLVEAATGNAGWGRGILVALGLVSIMLSATFIPFQHDIKRLLAYSSVEHIGIMVLGFGIGGFGSVAALLHMFNHSLAKTLSFASAGMLGQCAGTHNIQKLCGVARRMPIWGTGLFIGLLVLIGVAPFSIFLSEFFVLKAIVAQHAYWTACLFCAGLGVVFIAVLRCAIAIAWKPGTMGHASLMPRWRDGAFVAVPVALLLLFGLWLPAPLMQVLSKASLILTGMP